MGDFLRNLGLASQVAAASRLKRTYGTPPEGGYAQYRYTLDLADGLKPLLAKDDFNLGDGDRKAVVRQAKLLLAVLHPRTQPRAEPRDALNGVLREYSQTSEEKAVKARAEEAARQQVLDVGRKWRSGLLESAGEHDVFAIYAGLKSPHAEALSRADRIELMVAIREKLLETGGTQEADALAEPLATFAFEGKADEAVAAITKLNARDLATAPIKVEEVKTACDEAVSRYGAYTDTHFRNEIRSALTQLEEKLSTPEMKLQKVLVSQALKKLSTVERSAQAERMMKLPAEELFSSKPVTAEVVHDVAGQGFPSKAFWAFVGSESPELAALKAELPSELQQAKSYSSSQLNEIAKLQPALAEQVRSMLES